MNEKHAGDCAICTENFKRLCYDVDYQIVYERSSAKLPYPTFRSSLAPEPTDARIFRHKKKRDAAAHPVQIKKMYALKSEA